jgi:hypothetical protein
MISELALEFSGCVCVLCNMYLFHRRIRGWGVGKRRPGRRRRRRMRRRGNSDWIGRQKSASARCES